MSEYRITEFIAIIIFAIASWSIEIFFTPATRKIPAIKIRLPESQRVLYAQDPTLTYDVVPSETVSTFMLITVSYGVPLVLVPIIIKYFLPDALRPFKATNDTRNFLISIALSGAITQLMTSFIKTISGGLRPNFFALCEWDNETTWDGVSNLCTSASGEMKGRQSFPSGHASTAFSGLFFLSLYLAGRFQLNVMTLRRSASTRVVLAITSVAPTLLAIWISVTRVNDNYHHGVDVICGSVIGIAAALIGYYYNFGDILSTSVKVAGVPKTK